MEIRERILADLKEAILKKKDVEKNTLRMLKSDIMLQEVEKGRDLGTEEIQQVLKKSLKSREESARQYEEGGRPDLAEREREEANVIAHYLPQELDEVSTQKALESIAQELNITSKKELGRLMKELNARYSGRVNGRLAASLAGKILA